MLNHNTETVPRLYKMARSGGRYQRTLELLDRSRRFAPHIPTKSGVMVGLGEERDELVATFQDLRRVDCEILTIGQYLRPTPAHAPMTRYYDPEEFRELKAAGSAWALSCGVWSTRAQLLPRARDRRRVRPRRPGAYGRQTMRRLPTVLALFERAGHGERPLGRSQRRGAVVGGTVAAAVFESGTEPSVTGAISYRVNRVVGFGIEATWVPTLSFEVHLPTLIRTLPGHPLR